MNNQQSQTFAPAGTHTHTVILLHGRDSTAAEFESEFFESQASDNRTLRDIYKNIKWIFPDSGTRESSRFGSTLSQWFDMWSTEQPHEKEQDLSKTGIRDAISIVAETVHQESRLVPSNRIFLGGISQGCAVAIHALLYGLGGIRLGGFVGFCSWLPFQQDIVERGLQEAAGENALKTPVFLAHSRDDDVVAIAYGEQLRDSLLELGMVVTWHEYEDGGHWFNEPQGIDDVVTFFNRCIEEASEHAEQPTDVSAS